MFDFEPHNKLFHLFCGNILLQDTIIGLQALAEYALETQQTNTDLRCNITAAEKHVGDWHIDRNNLLVLRAAEVRMTM